MYKRLSPHANTTPPTKRKKKLYWKFATYVARLPSHRRVKRVLYWTPVGPRHSGRLPNSWNQTLACYCRYNFFLTWVDAAENQQW